jgi:hypothetical protein
MSDLLHIKVAGLFAAGLIGFGAATQADAATLNAGYSLGAGSQLLSSNGGAGEVLFNDGAALGGSDVTGSSADFYSVLLDGSGDWSVGETVSITGVALALVDSATNDGTFTFDIRQGSGGGGASGTTGLASLGTATATYTSGGGTSPYYVNFDTPVTFVADANSTSIVVNWSSTAQMRWKKATTPVAGGLPQVNFNNGNFVGTDDTVRFSIAGSVVPEPSSLALIGLGTLAMMRRRRG